MRLPCRRRARRGEDTNAIHHRAPPVHRRRRTRRFRPALAAAQGGSMIAGHFGFAAAVKLREPQVPLWALMLATAWLDVVFIPLYATGAEWIEPAPDATGSYGGGIIHANYTHSLVGALALAALFGAVAGWRWG